MKLAWMDLNQDRTAEERLEPEAAEKREAASGGSSAASYEQLLRLKRAHHQNRTKPTISLRISLATLKKAKQYGKGYTGFLSRLLDAAINDEDLVRKSI